MERVSWWQCLVTITTLLLQLTGALIMEPCRRNRGAYDWWIGFSQSVD